LNEIISVITASYNSEKTISNTLDSLINQTNKNFEFILIDGNSKDSTLKIVKQYEQAFHQKGINFKWISEQDSGIYAAWNKGLKMVKGEWVSFLGSDDILMPTAIDDYSNLIQNQSSKPIDLIHSKVEVVKNNKVIKVIDGLWSWKIFKNHMNIAHVGALHNMKYFNTYGVFDESYKITGDYELLLRAKDQLKCLYLDKVTAQMAYGGISTTNERKVFLETLRAKRETAQVNALICWFDFYIALFKFKIKNVIN
jgi:glycosyltransferase involved in cell wall biosynthesis